MPPSGDSVSRPAAPGIPAGLAPPLMSPVPGIACLARGTCKPHGKSGRCFDTSRQHRRIADPGQRQSDRVRAAIARRQVRMRIGLDAGQSDIRPALDQTDCGQARPGLRRPQGRDLPPDILGFQL